MPGYSRIDSRIATAENAIVNVEKTEPPAAGAPASESLWQKIWKVFAIFLPGPFKEAYKQGLLLLFIYIVIAIVAVPLLLAWLASFWLALAKDSPFDFLKTLQASYVEEIHRGFAIDELVTTRAKKQDAMIDYVIPLRFDLGRVDPKDEFGYRKSSITLATIPAR